MIKHIIHFLGGITTDESRVSNAECYKAGRLSAFIQVKYFADNMNGISDEEWRKIVYDSICGIIRREEPTVEI